MVSAGTLRILIVDDDALLRELVSARLRADGHAVIESGTGDEAAAALLAGIRPDVLVTDIAMPNSISGWCLAERCRVLYPSIPIVYTSSGEPDPARMLTNSRFVRKPYHPDDLTVAVEQSAAREPRPDDGMSGAEKASFDRDAAQRLERFMPLSDEPDDILGGDGKKPCS